MARLFGTDGVRGVVGVDLTCDLAMKIGIGAASVLTRDKDNVKIIIGNDGRQSADMLVASLCAGLTSVGVDVNDIGLVPTPLISYLVKYYKFDAGIMVTASHNPYEYNGIKIFDENGYKLADDLEDEIEDYIIKNKKKESKKIGKVTRCDNAVHDYIKHLSQSKKSDLSNLHIAVDAANGGASRTCKELFSMLGIKFDLLNNEPNGININDCCGALHIEELKNYVVKNKLDGGVAFDGDADRAIFIDENGDVIDGDHVLAILGLELKNNGKLNNNTIVGTIMTNLGLIKFCEKNDINFIATKVGDRYVLEELNTNNLSIGGEQSGHIIIKELANTGDGQLTAVNIFDILAKSKKKFSELGSIMKKYPQVMENVMINPAYRNEFYTNEEIKNIIQEINKKIENRGRVVVRPSGTEPIVRVMVEGEEISEIEVYANKIAKVIEKQLN